jgi:hypothetical protein
MKPLMVGRDYHPDVLKRFNRDVEEHEMSVLQDNGLYRHLRFARPSTGMGWFSIITTPGQLMVWGDHGCWAFAREQDMFAWFKGNHGYVNAGYWAEKLIAKDRNGEVEEYEDDLFRKWLFEYFWERRTDYSPAAAAHIWKEIREDILHPYTSRYTVDDAFRACESFRVLGRHPETYRFEFNELYELTGNWKTWNFHMLWNMHAILWAIQQYDDARPAAAA